MKYVKEKALFLKANTPQNLKNNKRQARKGVNKKGYIKRNTRYMTNSKNSEEKVSKKNKTNLRLFVLLCV